MDAFRTALTARLAVAADAPGVPARAIETLVAGLGDTRPVAETTAEPNPLAEVFDAAIAGARRASEDTADANLVAALEAIAPRLSWSRRSSEPGTAFHRGHANARIIGKDGLAANAKVTIGLSLMAPNVTYPDHHHPPEEVYLVLSPGHWRQNEEPWWQPGFGGHVYNPPNIPHAMRSGDRPLLAVWCLNH